MNWIMDEGTEERRKCTKCGVEYHLSFFRKNRTSRHTRVPTEFRKTICKKCEIEERIIAKKADPFTPKATKTIYEHAKKQHMTSKQFVDKYDLSVKYIASLFEDAWLLHEMKRACQSCGKPFDNDLRKFHLDVIDRKKEPTRSNLRVICEHCNLGKGKKDSTLYDFEMADHRHGEEAIKKGVQFDLPKPKTTPPIKTPQLTLF